MLRHTDWVLTVNKRLHDILDFHLFASFKDLIVLRRLDLDELKLGEDTGVDKLEESQDDQSDGDNGFGEHDE